MGSGSNRVIFSNAKKNSLGYLNFKNVVIADKEA
jgi:hypothetical protein